MAKASILSAIESASESDLAEIDAEIATISKRLASLEAARKLVALTVHGPTAKQPRKAKQVGVQVDREDSDPGSLSSRIYDLVAAEGSLPVHVIAARLGKTSQAIAVSAAKCGWFKRNKENELTIAKAG